MKIFISFFIIVTIFRQRSVQCQIVNSQEEISESSNTMNQSDKEQQDNNELGMKFIQNVFLHLARNPGDKNIEVVKTLLRILIAQKQNEQRMDNFWNLRHG